MPGDSDHGLQNLRFDDRTGRGTVAGMALERRRDGLYIDGEKVVLEPGEDQILAEEDDWEEDEVDLVLKCDIRGCKRTFFSEEAKEDHKVTDHLMVPFVTPPKPKPRGPSAEAPAEPEEEEMNISTKEVERALGRGPDSDPILAELDAMRSCYLIFNELPSDARGRVGEWLAGVFGVSE